MTKKLKFNVTRLGGDAPSQEIFDITCDVCPRIGESIMIMEEGNISGFYKVVNVMHVPESTLSNGTLLVTADTTLTETIKRELARIHNEE